MNQIQLYLNDQLTDLSDDSPIALTFQVNNLAEVQNQQGNTSNQFKLPLTQNNRQILGFPDDIALCTNLPYTQLQARYIVNGIEVMPYAVAEIQQVDEDFANIVLLSGNVDFFDAIDGKLYDMGDKTTPYGVAQLWQPYDHPWILDSIVQSQTKTEGWIWPVVDYGQIGVDVFTNAINVRQMRPGFFLHTAIELLCKLAGYKAKGSLLQNPLYQKLIVQFANDSFDHGADYQNSPDILGCIATTGAGHIFRDMNPSDDEGGEPIPFSIITSDPNNNFNPVTGVYTASENTSVTLSFSFNGKLTGDSRNKFTLKLSVFFVIDGVAVAPEIFDLSDNPVTIFQTPFQTIAYSEFRNKKITYDTVLAAGQKVKVYYKYEGGDRRNTVFELYAGATFQVKSDNQPVLYGQQVQCERIFPDVSQKDLLKDTLQRFGIICQTDVSSKTITFSSLKDIVANIPVAKNWTSKVVNQGKQVNYQLGNYAQKNWLRYKYDDGVTPDIMPQYFADDFIAINDKTINPGTPEQDLFVSIFAPSPNRPYFGGTTAQILKIDRDSDSVDFSIGTQPRLLVNNKIDLRQSNITGTKTVTFTDGTGNSRVVNDYISTPYFYKSDGEFSLCWNDKDLPGLKSIYYPELQKVLQQTKKIIRYLLLTPRDITELDLLTPVYLAQDGAYFYINKVDSWRKGQPCKVELVRLG